MSFWIQDGDMWKKVDTDVPPNDFYIDEQYEQWIVEEEVRRQHSLKEFVKHERTK